MNIRPFHYINLSSLLFEAYKRTKYPDLPIRQVSHDLAERGLIRNRIATIVLDAGQNELGLFLCKEIILIWKVNHPNCNQDTSQYSGSALDYLDGSVKRWSRHG